MKGSVSVAQTSLIGAVLSNLLLMVGIGIFVGGIDRIDQSFNQDVVGSLLNELVFGITTPILVAALKAFGHGSQSTKSTDITTLSRPASILLILSYICYAMFSLKSHAHILTRSHPGAKRGRFGNTGVDQHSIIAQICGRLATLVSGTSAETEESRVLASVSLTTLMLGIILDTVPLGFCTAFVCDSIDYFSQSKLGKSEQGLPPTFISLILLPVFGCNPHAITLARRDQMLQSFAISISGSAQLLLFVLPSTVLVGWVLGHPDVNLAIDGFLVVCLFISVISLKCVTAGSRSNWYDMVTPLLQTPLC